MNRMLALISLAVVAFIAGLVTFSTVTLQRSINVARARDINDVIGKINSAQQNMYQVLLSKEIEDVDRLSKTIDGEMKWALSLAKKAFKAMPVESRKDIKYVAMRAPAFSKFKDKLKESLIAELDALDKARDIEFDFVGEFSDFLGSPVARSLPESQLAMFESTTSLLRADSEAEFVSARLLFSAALADYRGLKKWDEERSRRLEQLFEDYARIKEGIFILRKERGFVISDTAMELSKMKLGLERARSSLDAAVTAQVERFLAIFLTVAVLFCIVFVAVLRGVVKRRIVDPILRLQTASQRLAAGEFVKVNLENRGDEIAQLARNFNHMATELHASTRRLEEQNNQLSDIFNNVRAGFCIINSSCQIQKGYTRACTELLAGDFGAGISITAALGLSPRDAGNYQALVEQVFEEDLSTDLALAQIPRHFVSGPRKLNIEYRVMRDSKGHIRALLLTIFDVTELEAARTLAQRNAELIDLASQRATLKRFAEAFGLFVKEARHLLEEAPSIAGSQEQVRRILHSLKGNFFILGLSELGEFVHNIEEKSILECGDLNLIEARFHAFLNEHRDLLRVSPGDDDDEESVEVRLSSIEQLRDRAGAAREGRTGDLQNFVLSWVDELDRVPAASVFAVAKATVASLNKKFRKGVVFEFTGQDVRLDPVRFRGVAAAIPHLINNAYDHGIESRSARAAAGKTEVPQIHLDVAEHENILIVTIRDNGAGIDAERLWQKAQQQGRIPATAPYDQRTALHLIFADNLSSADSVSSLSGRGIGSAAVKSEVEAIGGHVEVTSQRGTGTTIVLNFPKRPSLRVAS